MFHVTKVILTKNTKKWSVPLIVCFALLCVLLSYTTFSTQQELTYPDYQNGDNNDTRPTSVIPSSTFSSSYDPHAFNECTWRPNKRKRRVNVTRTKRVFLYTRYRSGSTFSSEFFVKNPDVFYIFEPLRLYEPLYSPETPDLADFLRKVLKRLFMCQFETYLEDVQKQQPLRILRPWLHHIFCFHNNFICPDSLEISASFFVQECRKRKMVVIKSIRIHDLDVLSPLMDENNIKVIQVIRDPRGLISSRTKFDGKSPHIGMDLTYEYMMYFATAAGDYCREILFDLSRTRGPKCRLYQRMFLFQKYEDLVANPLESAENIYNFLQMPLPKTVLDWAISTHKLAVNRHQAKEEEPYGTYRNNPIGTSQAWRKHLSLGKVLAIQSECQEMMNTVGYKLVNSPEELLNKSLSKV